MADVVLSGNSLVVVCRGTRYSTGVSINPSQPDGIDAAVRRAISAASGYFYGRSDAEGREVERINASAAAAAIRRSVARSQPSATPAPTQTAPPTPTTPPRQQAPPAQPPREERRREPATPPRQPERRQETPPATPRREEPPPRESSRRGGRTAQSTPRPTITQEWIEQQLRDARRDDRRAQAAASLLHSNRLFVEQFLDPGSRRGVERTDAQKNVTIALFNQLYQIPSFRLLLSSLAAQQQALPERDRVFSEFVTLQAFLTEPGRNEQLGPQAETRIIAAADTYIKYFLYNFVASNQDLSRFRTEANQLPLASWRMTNVEGARTFTPTEGRAPSDLDRTALMRLYLGSPIDADTLTTATLFMRRWYLEHPERGSGRSQSRIPQWTAPEVILPPTATPQAQAVPQPQAQPRAQAPAQPTEQPRAQPPATTVVPRIGAIGDSITEGGRYARTLQSSLRQQTPGAVVEAHGVGGQSITAISRRFRRDILDHSPAYNTVIIQGGVNGIMDLNLNQTQATFTRMISDARARNMRVILVTITPWASYPDSNDATQQRTAEINTWLRSQAQTDGSVVVVDMAQLGEGNPPRLRAAYSIGDGLHPNEAGRDLMAQLIAQAAYSRAPTVTETRSALQEFAGRNWGNLTAELYNHAQRGNPAGLITLVRNLPAGETSFERSLQTLRRDDVPRAFDRVFNDFLHRDRDFLEFCRTWREGERAPYEGVGLPSVTMNANTSAADRRLIMRAIQQYLNYMAGRTGQEWYGRLREDFGLMYREVLGTGRDTLDINGLEDVRTLAAIAVLSWRKAHQSEPVGAWGASLNITPRTPPQQQTPTAPPPQEGQRRRVIQPG